ncbi:MAG TPA: glycogen synthase GlgA [Candidatus Binatia bacterium]
MIHPAVPRPPAQRALEASKAALKVLFVASECAPFAKTGGLGDVIGALPKALASLGVDVRIVMPLYSGFDWRQLERLEGAVGVPMFFGAAWSGLRLGRLPGSDVPVYFLEYNHYFDRPYLYGPPSEGYADNLERFTFLSRGALEVTKALGWVPDVVHAHDWQSALVPVYVNTVEWGQPLHGCASVYSIHNLAYQGVFDPGAIFVTGLGREHLNPREFEHFGSMNLTKAALYHSTMLSTVSPTYAREIQTSEYGFGLDGVLRERSADLRGILNGIDVVEWDPANDPYLPARYDASDLSGKEICKATLQREAGLPVRGEVPVFGLVGRLVAQKGVDVLAQALERVLEWDLQIVLLGTGEPDAERYFAWLSSQRPDRFRAWIGFDNARAHLIEAGADFFLMPSRFEPCGLNQMYSLRYGTLPIVRHTGGLADSVQSYDERTGEGTGFVLYDLTPNSLADTIGWALATWYARPEHVHAMRLRAMAQDFSWERAAREYVALYLTAYERRRGHPFAG